MEYLTNADIADLEARCAAAESTDLVEIVDNDVPALIEEIRRGRAEIARLRESAVSDMSLSDRKAAYDAEINRLAAQAAAGDLKDAEIERLRELVAASASVLHTYHLWDIATSEDSDAEGQDIDAWSARCDVALKHNREAIAALDAALAKHGTTLEELAKEDGK